MDDTEFTSFSWLDAHRADPDVRVVDVREPWEFDGIGHVPGAVNVPFERVRSADGEDEGMLPGAAAFARVLGEAGVGPDDTIVAYDDTFGVFAARFVVTALVYGHRRVHLLDGDFSAWSREYAVTTEPTPTEPTSYDARPLSPDETPLIDRADVAAALESDALFVDTREAGEYAAGHLPGAVRFDWREVVDGDTRRLHPRASIVDRFSSHGITPDRRIVLYCNTARRISHTYLVLRWLGYEDVAFYEGSLTEWLDEGGAVETEDVI